MRPSRRDFLKTAGALAGGLSVARNLEGALDTGHAEHDKTAKALRESLLQRRQGIGSLHVEYDFQSSKEDDLLNGKNHLFMSRGRYHLRHEGREGTIVQILSGEDGLDAVIDASGTVAHIRRWNRSERRSIPRTLDNFLPQLEDKPMVPRGFRQLAGDRCLGLLQGDRLFWISTTKNVVRSVEFFRSVENLGERMLFGDFTEPVAQIFFPHKVQIFDFDADGATTTTKVITVNSVTINGPLSEGLFAVSQFPRKGEKLES